MRTPSSNFIKEKNKSENQPLFLYRIYDYDGDGADFFFVDNDEDVIFQNQLYLHFPIKHEEIGESTSGEIDFVKIILSNVSRLIQAYLELYDLRGKRVDIITIFANLDEEDACITDVFYIDSYTADQNNVTFSLNSKFDVANLKLPARKFSRNHCSWKILGDADCQYAGTETVCNKTLTRCRQLNNQINFGGFASVPAKGVYVQ